MQSHQSPSSTTATLASLNVDRPSEEPALSMFQQTIDIALNTFQDGKTINKTLKQTIKATGSTKNWRESKYSPFIQYKDAEHLSVPDYDGNRIEGTNFILCAGPKYSTAAAFFRMLIENCSDNTFIIGLGFNLSNDYEEWQDFFNYSQSTEEPFIFVQKNVEKQALYEITMKAQKITGEAQQQDSETSRLEEIVQTKLEVTFKDLKDSQKPPVTKTFHSILYPLWDGSSIHLSPGEKDYKEPKDATDVQNEILWNQFTASLSGTHFIHCAAGVGRSGHLLLMFEILKYYHEIFANQYKPEKAADQILKIVVRIRKNRPALIMCDEQFVNAIRNAKEIYNFALKKGYIEADKPVVESALAILKQKTAISKNDSDDLTKNPLPSVSGLRLTS